jgi:hypothetical protein
MTQRMFGEARGAVALARFGWGGSIYTGDRYIVAADPV